MFKKVVVLCALSLVPAVRMHAQVLYGSIVGNVTDPSDAPVSEATVVVTGRDTGQSRQTMTNDVGGYSLPTLPAGIYDLKVTRNGFTTLSQTGIEVRLNDITRIDLHLQIGSVNQTVLVSAEAPMLQTDRSEVRSEVGSHVLENLPLPPGRNYQQVFRTLPGFSPPGNAHSVPSNPARALTFNVNGASRSSNNTRIDGASSYNIQLPWVAAYVPSLEAIETVNVVTNSFDAEQGLAGGAAINVQTKSGTNTLHGSGFEYHTNNKLKAKPFFLPAGERNPKLVYNQFGGTIGGPIKKDKLFFFGAYEGTFDRENASRFSTVPTAAIRAGDMSDSPRLIYDPATGDAAGLNRTAFLNNQVPSSRISPISRKIISLIPLPNLPGLTNNYYATAPFTFDRHTLDAKLNWNVTPKLTTFVRYGQLHFNDYDKQVFGDTLGGPPISAFGGNPGNGSGDTYSLTTAATYVVLPLLWWMPTSAGLAPIPTPNRPGSMKRSDPIFWGFQGPTGHAESKAAGRVSRSITTPPWASMKTSCPTTSVTPSINMLRMPVGPRASTISGSEPTFTGRA
jgi:TonB-dependent Receptor Plug Domain.